jgi:ankyrin repeat protein
MTSIPENNLTGHESVDYIKQLIEQYSFKPSDNDNALIKQASELGNPELVEYLLALSNGSMIRPHAEDDYALRWAANNGHHETVRLLLRDCLVDPTAQFNCALRCATYNNHYETVKNLLEDPWVNSTDNHESPFVNIGSKSAIDIAKERGYDDIYELLIESQGYEKMQPGNEKATEVTEPTKTFNKITEFTEPTHSQPMVQKLDHHEFKMDIYYSSLEFDDNTGIVKYKNLEGDEFEESIIYPKPDLDLTIVGKKIEIPKSQGTQVHASQVTELLRIHSMTENNNDDESGYNMMRNIWEEVIYEELDVTTFLNDDRIENDYAIVYAASVGDSDLVTKLRTEYAIDPSFNNNAALIEAITSGLPEMIEQLMTDIRVDITTGNNIAIKCAAYYEDLKVLGVLLHDLGVDVHDTGFTERFGKDSALRIAQLNESDGVIETFQNYGFSVETDDELDTLLKTYQNNYRELWRLLINKNDVDTVKLLMKNHTNIKNLTTLDKNYPIRWAAHQGRYGIVKYLIEHGRVNFSAANDYALRWAANNGHHKTVKLLLQKGADPLVEQNGPLRYATYNGHVKTVQILLDNEADPCDSNKNKHPSIGRKSAIILAHERKCTDITDLFKQRGFQTGMNIETQTSTIKGNNYDEELLKILFESDPDYNSIWAKLIKHKQYDVIDKIFDSKHMDQDNQKTAFYILFSTILSIDDADYMKLMLKDDKMRLITEEQFNAIITGHAYHISFEILRLLLDQEIYVANAIIYNDSMSSNVLEMLIKRNKLDVDQGCIRHTNIQSAKAHNIKLLLDNYKLKINQIQQIYCYAYTHGLKTIQKSVQEQEKFDFNKFDLIHHHNLDFSNHVRAIQQELENEGTTEDKDVIKDLYAKIKDLENIIKDIKKDTIQPKVTAGNLTIDDGLTFTEGNIVADDYNLGLGNIRYPNNDYYYYGDDYYYDDYYYYGDDYYYYGGLGNNYITLENTNLEGGGLTVTEGNLIVDGNLTLGNNDYITCNNGNITCATSGINLDGSITCDSNEIIINGGTTRDTYDYASDLKLQDTVNGFHITN